MGRTSERQSSQADRKNEECRGLISLSTTGS